MVDAAQPEDGSWQNHQRVAPGLPRHPHFQTICRRLAEGESLRAIRADPAMPARATVFRWLARNQEFRRSYAIARDCLAEDLMDAMLEIADDSSSDYVEKTGADGKVTLVSNDITSKIVAAGSRPANGR